MTAFAPWSLLIFSALLHAMWNAAAKISRDKDTFVFLTILFACILVLAALLLNGESVVLGGPVGFKFALLAGIFEGFYLVAVAKSLKQASLVKAYSIMRGGAMVLVWIISLTLAMEHFSPVSLLGSVLVLLGIYISGMNRGKTKDLQKSNEVLWPLLAAIFIAGYHICYGESLKSGAEPKSLFFTSLLISIPFIYFSTRENFKVRVRQVLRSEKTKLLISSFGAASSFVIFLYGLRNTGPGYAITLRNTSIFFSIGFSYLIRDQITKIQIAGAVIIGIGAMILSLGGT